MLEDLWKSVKANLYDRTASPLFGAIAISWALLNYRLIVLLFSDQSPPEKFQYIDTVLYPNVWAKSIWLFAGPVVAGVLFLLVYPFPARAIYRFWQLQQKKLKEIRRSIEDETPLTVEESRQLRERLVAIRSEYEGQLRHAREEADELRTALAETQERLEESEREISDLHESLGDVAQQVDEQRGARRELLSRQITPESLAEYTDWKYPDRAPSSDIAELLLRDIKDSEVETLGDLDEIVDRVHPAVEAYAKDNPDVFRFATDYLTKSLGFGSKAFRRNHGFAKETQEAFTRYEDLIDGGRL